MVKAESNKDTRETPDEMAFREAVEEGRSEDAGEIARKWRRAKLLEPPEAWRSLFGENPPPRWRDTLRETKAAGINPGECLPDGMFPAVIAALGHRADALEALLEEGVDIHTAGYENVRRDPVSAVLLRILFDRRDCKEKLDPLTDGEKAVLRVLAHQRTHKYALESLEATKEMLADLPARLSDYSMYGRFMAEKLGKRHVLGFLKGICSELNPGRKI